MTDTEEIGVLLLDPVSAAQIGFIQFDPSGMLIYRVIQPGLNVNALRPIHQKLAEEWIKEPLYEKHASLLDENKKLPETTLEEEAKSCTDFLNHLDEPLRLGGTIVEAQVVSVRRRNEL
jgi:hypothetical protein